MHTQETIRVRYFMDLLMEKRRPIMLVGSAGTGKTVLVGDKFAAMDPDTVMVTNVPFNYYTTSAMLQSVLEKPLEKKAGRNYGPPGTKKLIYFIDDMNMPMVGLFFRNFLEVPFMNFGIPLMHVVSWSWITTNCFPRTLFSFLKAMFFSGKSRKTRNPWHAIFRKRVLQLI